MQAIRQTGSSSKPLTVLVPGLAENKITPASTYTDEQTMFIDYNNEEYSPTNYNDYLGEITVRRAVESSQNIPFVKMMEEITPSVSMRYLKKMGISTLTDRDENLALSLGGLDKGISPLEMAGAYGTIANDGVYRQPIFYTKVSSTNGKTILKAKQKTRRVFSEGVAYVTKQLLTQPVVGSKGTATYCKIAGMDVAAKTGTTNEDYDRWLCGFTNYYTAVTWFGYDMSERIEYNGRNPAGIIWSNVMNRVHAKLKNSQFQDSKGVVSLQICKKSFKVANSGCTDVYTEYFVKGSVPANCGVHQGSILQTIEESNNAKKVKESLKNTIDDVKSELSAPKQSDTKQQVLPESEEIEYVVPTPEVKETSESNEVQQTLPQKQQESQVVPDVSQTTQTESQEPVLTQTTPDNSNTESGQEQTTPETPENNASEITLNSEEEQSETN